MLDKICKYEMDSMSIVEDTERTPFYPQTDRRTDGQGDTSTPPFQLRWSRGYNNVYACDELFMHSLECYFGIYFPCCSTTQEINTKITLKWVHKQFAIQVHTLLLYPRNEVRGGILDSPCLSVRLSVCLLTFRVRPVASTVQDGFFPYLVQMINSMRGCVACDDPWPISSRSLCLDLENHVRSVASTVLNGFFLYLAQMITIIRGCVPCYVFFRIWKF